MEDGVYLIEDRRYLIPDSLALTSDNSHRGAAHHYLTEDRLSLTAFYDYLLSDNGKLMDELSRIKNGTSK